MMENPTRFIASRRFGTFLHVNDSVNATNMFTGENRLYAISELIFVICTTFSNALGAIFVIFPFPLWKGMKHFKRLVAEDNTDSLALIKKYEELKNLSRCGNEIWASLYLIGVITMSMKLVLFFDESVRSHNVLHLVINLGIQALLLTSLILGAEISRMVKNLRKILISKRWEEKLRGKVMERIRGENRNQCLDELIEQLEIFPVGIGTTGVYQLNYSFISQGGNCPEKE
ncbi:unnamed protein product [Orchesella dallaii]|uniref:Uncharacterized protein n=1 Tax=Orchesella dallaii TaxID=48710 RepID=A0ABP1R8A2_9HEXA